MIEKLGSIETSHMSIKELQLKVNEIIDHLYREDKKAPETWTVKIRKGQTIEGTLRECGKLFKVWWYTDSDLDELVTSDRNSSEAYKVSFRVNVEADEGLKNKSAEDLERKGIKGITLLERLQLEVDYFKSASKHLDIESWTLCSGSRNSDGSVPCVDWRDGKMRVNWYRVGIRDSSFIRSRQVVNLVP